MSTPILTPGRCTALAVLGGVGLAATAGVLAGGAAVAMPVAALGGVLGWLGGVAGNQVQSWLGSKLKHPPPDAEAVFKNHHIRQLLSQALIATVERLVPIAKERLGGVSQTLKDSGKTLAKRLDALIDSPSGTLAEVREFNVTTILTDYATHQGVGELLSEQDWQQFINEVPALKDLLPDEHEMLVSALHLKFGEALWGLVKHAADTDPQAFAAVELLYLSQILKTVQTQMETPPDLSPIITRISALLKKIDQKQQRYFLSILGGLTALQDMLENFIQQNTADHAQQIELLTIIKDAVTAPKPAALMPLHQLPSRPEGFVGREADLVKLRAMPTSGTVLTGLRGMGGIGKTALGLVLAHEWAARFPDAQLFLDGRGTHADAPTAEALLSKVINTFHPTAKLPDDLPTLQGIYRDVLREKRVLLFLDNAKDAAQARPLIPPAGCALIVTSRNSIMLGTTRPHDVGRLPDAEAAALLREFHAALTDAEAANLVRLCAGLPLALRLAGSHLAFDGPAPDVAGYIRALSSGRLQHLDAEAEDAGEITISETLRLSEAQLTEADRIVWRALSIYTASFESRAAEVIAGADAAILTTLLRRSLLEREGTDRYKLHDLAADYAREKLSADARTDLALAHARHYTAVGDETDTLCMKGQAVDSLALFDRERAQIEAAYAWLNVQSGEAAAHQLIALVDSIVHTGQELRFNPQQRIAWLESQLHAARLVNNRPGEGAALGNLGDTHTKMGEVRKAIEYYLQALVISREMGSRLGMSFGLGSLGNAYSLLDDFDKAIGYFMQSLDIALEIGHRRQEGIVLGNLGNAFLKLGDAQKAMEFQEQRLAITKEIGDLQGQGQTLGNIGNCYAILHEARKAIEFYGRQLVIVREIGDLHGEGNALWNAALSHAQLDHRPEAIAHAAAALAIYESIEDPNAAMVRAMLAEWRG